MARRSTTTNTVIGLFITFALIAAGCGGGGGGVGAASTSASGLTVADTVSAVTAKGGTTTGGKPNAKPGASEKLNFAPNFAPNFAIDTTPIGQYGLDSTFTYVRDDTREALNEGNGILCILAQTGYDKMVNKGNYIALIDTDSCFNKEGDHGSGSATGESSGAGEATNLDTAVLNITRADNASPQVGNMWMDISTGGGGGKARAFGQFVVTAPKSAANPYGLFTVDFKSKRLFSDGTLGAAGFNGHLEVLPTSGGLVSLILLTSEGDVTAIPAAGQRAELRKAAALLSINAATGDAVSGQAYVFSRETGNFGSQAFDRTTEANVAYSATNFLSSLSALSTINAGTNTCYDRTTFTTNIWRYGLYNVSDGSRVARNSGFPIRTASGGFGFLGYWGLWISPSAPVADSANGATVTKQTFSGGAAQSFTLVAGPGKLVQRTKKTLTLGDLINVTLEYGCFNAFCATSGPGGGSELGSRFQVSWNGSNLVKTAVAAPGQQGQTWVPITGNLTLPTPWNNFWAQALSGQAQLLTSTLSNLTSVIFHTETNVTNLQTSNLTLYCTGSCLKANITQSQANGGCTQDGLQACQPDPQNLASIFSLGSPYAYLFSFGDLTLYTTNADGTAASPVKTVAAVAAITGQNRWGFRTRGMVLSSTGMTNPWDSWNQAAVYEWETGPNTWNRFITARDSNGNFATFDPPIRIVYQHLTANDVNGSAQYNGASFQLEYVGFGNLNGIPWVATSGEAHGWGAPAFGLKNGVVVDSGGLYKVRALNRAQRMNVVAASNCSALTLPTLTPPAPTLLDVPTLIGPRPTVTTAPAFIKGVPQ